MFVENEEDVDVKNNKYLIDPHVEVNFPRWKYAFMKMLIDAQKESVIEPIEVKEHTNKLIDRDNTVKKFVETRIMKSKDKKELLFGLNTNHFVKMI